MATGFEALAEFEDAFEAATVKPKYGSEQSKAVADGDYVCQLTGAIMKDTAKGSVFTFMATIISDCQYKGWTLEKTIFLQSSKGSEDDKKKYTQDRMGELKKDFATLGFDSEKWTKANNRPVTTQLPAACELLKGMKIKMRKKTGDYANVYLNDRVKGDDKKPVDGKPEKIGAEELAAVKVPENAGAPATAAPPAETYNSPDSPIPF